MLKQKNDKVFDIFIVILAIMNMYYSIVPHFSGSTMDVNHKLMAITIALFFLLNVLTKSNLSKISIFALGIIVVSFLFVSLDGKLVFSYYTKWILFASSILLYVLMVNYRYTLSRRTFTVVYISVLLPVFIYIIEAFDPSFYIITAKGQKLILTFDNQNSAAMQLLMIACVLFLFLRKFLDEQKKGFAHFTFIVIGICAVLIYLTGARSSLFAIIFILLFFVSFRIRRLVSEKTLGIIILFPIIFAFLFVVLYINGFTEIQILGRNIFNGREDLWLQVFRQPLSNWIFGSYDVFTVGDGSLPFQLHNGIVDMIASYGLLVTIVFLFCLFKMLKKILSRNTNMSQLIVVCILALIIQSTGEAALFIGNRCNFICMIFIFLSSVSTSDEQSEELIS